MQFTIKSVKKMIASAAIAGFLFVTPVMMHEAMAVVCSDDSQCTPNTQRCVIGVCTDVCSDSVPCADGSACQLGYCLGGGGGGGAPEMPDVLAATFLLAGAGTVFYLRRRAAKKA